MDIMEGKTLDPGSQEFLEQFNALTSQGATGAPDAPVEAAPEAPPSPVSEQKEDYKAALEEARAQVDELRQKADSTDLRERLARLEGRLSEQTRSAAAPADPMKSWDETKLIQQETAWEETLTDAKYALAQAQLGGQSPEIDAANRALLQARQSIVAIRQEKQARLLASLEDKQTRAQQQNQDLDELAACYEDFYKGFPDLANRQSAIWKAGKTEYDTKPEFYQKFGPVGDLMALVRAISTDPNLTLKSAPKAAESRLRTFQQVQRSAQAAIPSGTASTSAPRTSDFSTYLDTPGKAQDFERMLNRVMNG